MYGMCMSYGMDNLTRRNCAGRYNLQYYRAGMRNGILVSRGVIRLLPEHVPRATSRASPVIVFAAGRAVEPEGSQPQSHLTWTSQRVLLGVTAWPSSLCFWETS